MTRALYRLGRGAARHPWRVIAIWVVLAVGVVGLNRSVGGDTTDDFRLPGTESQQAIDLLDWGGQCILLGVPKLGTEASFVVNTLYNDKSIMGCRYGSTRPHHDVPMYVNFYLDGRLQLDEMVSKVYDLADIEEALTDMHAGKLNRGVLSLS